MITIAEYLQNVYEDLQKYVEKLCVDTQKSV